MVIRFADKLGNYFAQGLVIVSLFIGVYAIFSEQGIKAFVYCLETQNWHKYITRPSLIFAQLGILLLAFRTVLWFRYRPTPRIEVVDAPMLTVIIPAYNEGAMVEKSIDSVASAHYPRHRLEIIAVDDGSQDDTWRYILRAAARYPNLVKPMRFDRNRGKRAALAEGFRSARGDILVTIDSDSVIEAHTLLAIVSPFRNRQVGAVAGRVDVYNRDAGILPRMLHVAYALSFDFLRAVQSTYGTVYCCPGALSAYRASVVRKVLDRWTEQLFLGSPCTYGEDRALTNFILAENYATVYQRTAVVRTVVPTTYRKLCKMLLRWDRSYVREELRLLCLIWARRGLPVAITALDRIVTNGAFLMSYASLVLIAATLAHRPWVLIRVLIAIGITASLSMGYYLRLERSWSFLYGILYAYFSFFALSWIFPYAVLTVRSRSWLTR